MREILVYFTDNKKPGTMPGASGNNQGVQQGMPDPIGALQTLARQGTGNNANIGMQAPNQNPQNQQSTINNSANREFFNSRIFVSIFFKILYTL